VLQTYPTHHFIIKDVSTKNSVNFTKGPLEEAITVYMDETSKSLQIMKNIQDATLHDRVHKSIKYCSNFQGDSRTKCLADELVDDIMKLEGKIFTII